VGRLYRIAAHNNAVGPGIIHYVPELLTARRRQDAIFGYCTPNDDRDPIGYSTRCAIARLEQIELQHVRITGSVLEFVGVLPAILNRRSVIKLTSDFRGYARGATGSVKLIEIPVDVTSAIDPGFVADFVKNAPAPIVFLTFPVTNPGQQPISLDIVESVLRANSQAVVVVDNAYRGSLETEGLARYALSNSRTLYLNTASKNLFLCGGRFGWAIAATPLLDRIPTALPYGVGADSLDFGLHILSRPHALRAARATQAQARDILNSGLRRLGAEVRSGPGPWILVQLGDDADRIVKVLADTFLIDVQLQTDALTGWIRISATVPCEADRIVSALASILGTATTSVEHAFQAELKLQSLVRSTINAERHEEWASLLTSN
jgi:histidinol-phosphate/aromatic aminotransferase/cobyric acid decarboxylase-like protein